MRTCHELDEAVHEVNEVEDERSKLFVHESLQNLKGKLGNFYIILNCASL
jgi:hypothetical protein